jgi:hypothetical protein
MREDDGLYVGHMLDLSRKVAAKISGIHREEFDKDENLRLALAHLLQSIGEVPRGEAQLTRAAVRPLPGEQPCPGTCGPGQ